MTEISFNPFLVYEAKRKKRWIGLNLRVIQNLVNLILEENINLIKSGIQAKSGLTNSKLGLLRK